MPVTVRKVKGGFQVRTPGGVKAKHTTARKAEGQRRLLEGIEHGTLTPRRKPIRSERARPR